MRVESVEQDWAVLFASLKKASVRKGMEAFFFLKLEEKKKKKKRARQKNVFSKKKKKACMLSIMGIKGGSITKSKMVFWLRCCNLASVMGPKRLTICVEDLPPCLEIRRCQNLHTKT